MLGIKTPEEVKESNKEWVETIRKDLLDKFLEIAQKAILKSCKTMAHDEKEVEVRIARYEFVACGSEWVEEEVSDELLNEAYSLAINQLIEKLQEVGWETEFTAEFDTIREPFFSLIPFTVANSDK